MDGWGELARAPLLRPPLDPNAQPQQVTCSMFDEQSDLIWAGDSAGYIASYRDLVLAPYTRFRAHELPVKQLLPHKRGVLSTDGRSLRLTSRTGQMILHCSVKDHPEFNEEITKMAVVGPNELLIATDSSLVRFDTTKNSVISSKDYFGNVVLMASNKRHVALGRSNGSVDIYEVKSGSIIHTFVTNSSTLSDLDLKENTLVTCGLTSRHTTGSYTIDPFVNVFDLRTMRLISPVSFPAGASHVRLHPRLPSVAVIASKTGQMQVVDMFNQTNISLYQADVGPMILSFELSSTGDFLSIVDAYSSLHFWAHNPEHSSMSNRAPLEFADPPVVDKRYIDVDDDSIPLSAVGMPYYKDTLLSAWPTQAVFRSAGTIPNQISDTILQSAHRGPDGILRAPYDKDKFGRRNLAKKYVPVATSTTTSRFLSHKSPSKGVKPKSDDIFEYKFDPEQNKIPNAFKKLEILYSKFGIDDFDFDSYNQTKFTGLECHVDNSYTNALLQLYRFVPEMFNFAVESLSFENLEPDSLLTEMGYLFDMLVKSPGKHYRPTNFQHTLSSIEEAKTGGLLEKDNVSVGMHRNLVEKIQWFNRFFLQKLARNEHHAKAPEGIPTDFEAIMGIKVQQQLRSLYYHEQNIMFNWRFSLDLAPPPYNRAMGTPDLSLISLIQYSLRVEQQTVPPEYAGTPGGPGFDIHESIQQVVQLPPVLSCNVCLSLEEKRAIRDSKNWLKKKFYAVASQSEIIVDVIPDRYVGHRAVEYELVGFVAEISGESEKDSHLVTFVNILDDETGEKSWYLFNDFLVIPIPEEEVLNVSYWWKTPVTLVYRDTSNPAKFEYEAWKRGLDDGILYRDHFAAGTREGKRIEYELLTREEAPKPGSLVAIDTEFVTLEAEQYEIKSNGSRVLLKPSTLALARVSVLRGEEGEKLGVPFIDDWVVVREGIHDYFTSFSGIEPGDLDPATSDKALVTLQTVYRKLWLLLNLGCVFVGHGLTKDFRTINISVPKSQVRDTAVFFYKGQRILSLRFLAYILLNKKVQEGNHDSIEDAHTALLLYREYERLKATGEFEDTLNQIYIEGQALKFKPPGEE